MRLRLLTGLLVLLTAVLPATLNAATSPTDDQYGNQVTPVVTEETNVAGVTTTGDDRTLADATVSLLPFTGFQLAFAFALGLALVVAGLVIRGRRRTTA